MSQQSLTLELALNVLSEIDAAITTLEVHLGQLPGLRPEQRRRLPKMGNKSEAFCRQALVTFSQNPAVLPRDFDVGLLQKQLHSLDLVRPIRTRLTRLYERLRDAEMQLGSNLMRASLEGYAVLKVSGGGQGLDSLRNSLSQRFAFRRSQLPDDVAEDDDIFAQGDGPADRTIR